MYDLSDAYQMARPPLTGPLPDGDGYGASIISHEEIPRICHVFAHSLQLVPLPLMSPIGRSTFIMVMAPLK